MEQIDKKRGRKLAPGPGWAFMNSKDGERPNGGVGRALEVESAHLTRMPVVTIPVGEHHSTTDKPQAPSGWTYKSYE